MTAGFRAMAIDIPESLVQVDSLPELARLPEVEAKTFRGLGIDTVAADDDADAWALAARAGTRALAAASLAPGALDTLLVVGARVPEQFMASDSTRIQQALGATRAATYSVGDLGCVSISAALVTARALLASAATDSVLVVHGSKPPAPRRYRHPVTINGDGGVAALLTNDAQTSMIDIDLETDGGYWDLFRVRYRDIPYSQWFEECTSTKDYSFKLAIESRNRFAAMNEAVLGRSGITLGDVDHFVMQNLSAAAFRFYEEFFDIEFAKCCKRNLQRYGHLGSMDVVLNLHTGIESGEFVSGERVLVMNNSPVAAWSTMLVEV